MLVFSHLATNTNLNLLFLYSPRFDGNIHQVHHTETVMATTPIQAFIVSKSDFHHLAHDTKQQILDEIAEDRGATLAMGEDTWRRNAAWDLFKKTMMAKTFHKPVHPHREEILDCYRATQRINFNSDMHSPLLQVD